MNEIFQEALTCVLKAAVIAISAVVTYYLKTVIIPWLQDKQLYTAVKQSVQAAAQMGSAGMIATGEDKKKTVVALLQSHGVEVTPVVNALIESAVEELDNAKITITETIAEGVKENGEQCE